MSETSWTLPFPRAPPLPLLYGFRIGSERRPRNASEDRGSRL